MEEIDWTKDQIKNSAPVTVLSKCFPIADKTTSFVFFQEDEPPLLSMSHGDIDVGSVMTRHMTICLAVVGEELGLRLLAPQNLI